MRTITFGAAILAMLVGSGMVAAQAPTAKPDEHSGHHPGATVAPGPGAGPSTDATTAKGGGMMGGGMMGGGMMGMMSGGMMGGGMCPMMGSGNTKVEVKKIDKGVTITMTSSDAATATRLQKMAEAMRLMHEATAQ
jgi:hypothetical protein